MMKLAILLIAAAIAIGAPAFAVPANPTELNMNITYPNGSNMNTSLRLTIDYTDGDSNPQSINSIDNAGSGSGGTVNWTIKDGKSRLYSAVAAKDGTTIYITLQKHGDRLRVTAIPDGSVSGSYTLDRTSDEFKVMMNSAISVGTTGTVAFGISTTIFATALKSRIALLNSTTPLVLDVRNYTEYTTGHIPGAINIPYRTLGNTSALAYLDAALAAHTTAGGKNEIVVYHNTRHISRMVAIYLNKTQGYNVLQLNNGMNEWTTNETVAPKTFRECNTYNPTTGKGSRLDGLPCVTNKFPTQAGLATNPNSKNASTLSGEGYPVMDNIVAPVTSADLKEVARAAYNKRFGDETKPEFEMTAAELYNKLDDNQDGTLRGAGDDLSNDPFILSNRGTDYTTTTCPTPGDYYTQGHVPGAAGVNFCIGNQNKRFELTALNLTDFLPTNKEAVVNCWVGASQQYAAAYYNLLGYEVRSLDWGINSWTINITVRNGNTSIVGQQNYEYHTTPDLGNATTNSATYAVGDTVYVTWNATAAPTQPNYVMVEFYNSSDGNTIELIALSPSATSTTHVVTPGEFSYTTTVYIYYADHASDKHGDPGTTDLISTSYTTTVAPEFPYGIAMLFAAFMAIYFSMRPVLLHGKN